jgi:HD domain
VTIAGVRMPDSRIAREATELICDTTTPLIYHHSRRVFLFGTLQSRVLGIEPEPELLYVAALFHDTGLVWPYRGSSQRFELDSADAAKSFLKSSGFADTDRFVPALRCEATGDAALPLVTVAANGLAQRLARSS